MALKLVFRGDLTPGVTAQQAAERLAKMVGQSPADVKDRLFSGRPVTIKTVDTEDEARRFVAAFSRAGAKLEVQRVTSEAAASNPHSRKQTPRKRRRQLLYGAVAFAALIIGGVTAGAWYTAPVWHNGTVSDEQAIAGNALATRDVIALGHLDVQRATDLQARLFGVPDADALPGQDDKLWDSLLAAGIDPRDAVDDAIVALYVDGAGADWAVVLPGRIDFDAMHTWLGNGYDIERVDAAHRTIYFSWTDPDTCESVPLKGARVGDSRVLIADAGRLDSTWARLEAAAAAETSIDDWFDLTERQVLTIGIFSPTSMGQATDGLAGVMLARAGQAAEPAQAVYFGVAPALMPPGIILSGAVASDDQPFLEKTHGAASKWLADAKSAARTEQPALLDIYDRMSVALSDRTLSANVRLDTDFDDELQTLIGALFRPTVSVGSAQAGSSQKLEDEVDDDPLRFVDASGDGFAPYASFGSGHFEPQWQQGPFAMTVSRLLLGEDGRRQITLKGQGRGLANLGDRAGLVRLRITGVVDAEGRTLLPELECGPARSRDWSDGSRVATGSQYQNGEFVSFPTVDLEKKLTLAAGATAREVAAIRGEIEYLLPNRVRSERVDAPLDGEVVEGEDIRIRFQKGSDRSVNYQASGDTRRLLTVRALNAEGRLLKKGASTRGENWFGSGEHASVDIKGQVAAAEVVLAEQFEPLVYSFELPGAFPPMGNDSPRSRPPVVTAAPGALTAALQTPPPAVTFEYNQPESTLAAGPALVAVNNLRTSAFTGLVAQLEVFVSNELPLAGQLNGSSIVLDRAELSTGETVALDLASAVSLRDAGGYWMNGEYTPDPDKPWLKGRVMLQDADYEGGTPAALHGHIVFRAARDLTTETSSVAPGTRLEAAGTEVVVGEWREDSVNVQVPSGAGQLVSIEMLDADGELVGRAERIEGTGAHSSARVTVDRRPQTLRVSIATESEETEVPFSADLTPGASEE